MPVDDANSVNAEEYTLADIALETPPLRIERDVWKALAEVRAQPPARGGTPTVKQASLRQKAGAGTADCRFGFRD